MPLFTPFHRLFLAALLLIAGFAAMPARAQTVPDAEMQEAIVKETLITFNDANVTGNYDVLHKKTAAPFQEKFAPADLAEMFKSFPDNKIDISPVAGMDPIEDNPPTLENGILTLDGHFATSPLEVNYVLSLVIEEGYWRLIGFDISAKAPE